MLNGRAFLTSMAVVAVVAVAPSHATEPPTGITIVGPSAAPARLNLEALGQLQAMQIHTNFPTESGQHSASFTGPLLWAVLEQTGAIDPAQHGDQVRQTIIIVGRDGYRAVLAVGEIAPEFEAKQVILAERMNGQPLDADHLRVVVPLDKRGGRSVRDVVRIEVTTPPPCPTVINPGCTRI
jgi:DMSO/TMAO reductase YedYZ molybdopterin-dependent catalytic subunit